MSEKKSEAPYIVIEKSGGLGAFLWGAIAGAAVALLLAPKSGEETQEELKERARKLRDDAEQKFNELKHELEDGYDRARQDLTQRIEEAREEVRERKRQAEEALRAGKEAAQKARGDLERRVAQSKAAYRAEMQDGPAARTAGAAESGTLETD